jgi:hypothetical protein
MKIIPSLRYLIDKIENCPSPDFEMLSGAITEAGLTTEDFAVYNQFNHDTGASYGRNRLYAGRNFSIFLMSWNQHDYTAIHSHGQCDWGAVYFFNDAVHRLYKVNGNEIHLAGISTIPAGTIAPVNGNLVHSMGNDAPGPILTLHIYGSNGMLSNANEDSRVYQLEKDTISVTNGEAYLNLDPAAAKEQSFGIVSDIETISDYFAMLLPFYTRIGDHGMVNKLEKGLALHSHLTSAKAATR